VSPSASTEEIRAAYRTLAARLHPDRAVSGTPAERALAERRMREVNEAWQVLQDPGRRRRYDDSRLAGSRPRSSAGASGRSTAPAVPDDDDLVDVLPNMGPVQAGLFRHGPWFVVLVVLGLIFVGTAYATSSDDEPAPRAPESQAGTCVDVSTGPTTTVVPCSGPHELRIVRRVPDGGACPVGTEKRRLAADGYLDCVRAE
jgi:hypothetical protein